MGAGPLNTANKVTSQYNRGVGKVDPIGGMVGSGVQGAVNKLAMSDYNPLAVTKGPSGYHGPVKPGSFNDMIHGRGGSPGLTKPPGIRGNAIGTFGNAFGGALGGLGGFR